MPKPVASKSKTNPNPSYASYPPDQFQQNFYYPGDPNMMYADPYQQQMMMNQNQQQMMMNQNQMTQYQMGYYPPQGYPMLLDESRQVSDSPKASPKSAKAKPKKKFSLFGSKKTEDVEVKKSKDSLKLPPIEASEKQQLVSKGNAKQPDKATDNKKAKPTEDDQEAEDLVSPSAEVDDSRSTIDTTSGNINVVIRVRPPNALELKNGYSSVIDCANDGETLFVLGPDGSSRSLTFNKVYDQNATQEIFFNQSGIKELMSQAMAGYSICIFAFGQTGSGKSFTITGPEGQLSPNTVGIVPRALKYLFEEIMGGQKAGPSTLRASYLEIYNEHVYDLLNPKGPSLPIRWNAEKGFFVENLYVIDCEVLDDCLAILEEGLNNRTTASHRMNEHSSRSHSVMTVHLDSEFQDPVDGRVIQRHGKISFVDLAGSERVKESRAQGETLTETLNINKSLLTLGKCIAALSDPRKRTGHIPYRDSKLTKLLSDSLGGNGMALMVACISPALQNLTETVKTLRYAQSAKKIKNKPVINLDPREEMLYMLKREIQALKKENDLLKNAIFSDKRYEDLLDFITQGKHLADLPEISRGPSGKTNIVYKDLPKGIGYTEDDAAGVFDNSSTGMERKSHASSSSHRGNIEQSAGLDRSFRASASFNRGSIRASASFNRGDSNQSALEKYRQNRKFTPGLVENKEVTNTWRNARSISRNTSRGRQASRSGSIRERSVSASTRASIVSRSSSALSRADSFERPFRSSVTRADSIQRPSIAPKKPNMNRELSGRFDYNTVPELNLKNRKNSDLAKVSNAPKEQSTSMTPQPDDTSQKKPPKKISSYMSTSEDSSNDENSMKLMQRKVPELSEVPETGTEKKNGRSEASKEETKPGKESKSSKVDNTAALDENDVSDHRLQANEDLESTKKMKSKELKDGEKKSRSKDKDSKEDEKKSRSKKLSDQEKTKPELEEDKNPEPKKKSKSPADDTVEAESSVRMKKDSKISDKKEKSDEPKMHKKADPSTNDKDSKKEKSKNDSEKKTSLVRKESEVIGTESDDHKHLPDIIKLKKKTMKDVIALDEEIARMS